VSNPLTHRRFVTAVLMLVLGAVGALALSPAWTLAAAPDPATAAWQRARAAGNYRFTSDVTQVTLPLATLANVGRTSRSEELYMEGQNDLRAQQMAFTLWTEGGSVLQAESGVSVRTEDGKTYARRGAGEWEVVDDMTGAIAPQGDFLGYLAAIRAVAAQPGEARGGIAFTRYTFEIDSPRFAEHMHEQMTAALHARGELPPGLQLEVPAYFRDMVGSGELWVGNDGLPLRQILTLQFPPQNDEQVHAQIVVNFFDFGHAGLVTSHQSPVTTQERGATITAWLTHDAAPLVGLLPLLAVGALLLYFRRTRALQTAIAIVIIAAEVGGPLLSTHTNVRFFDVQSAKAADQTARQAAADEERAVREALGKVEFNPHVSPLENRDWRLEIGDLPVAANLQSPIANLHATPAQQTTDSGLDTDGDTLTDFAEARIGTSAVISDTDGDGIDDNVEVAGFSFGGQQWYTAPDLTDSNGDGLVDGLEWGLNGDGSLRATPLDSDGDGFPDLFDPDNDGDGVPDHKDLAPFAKGAATFGETTPLQLTLNNLTAGKPTFVEFQLRPEDEQQLWFAYNVLDWPEDSVGQMRDVDSKTYADAAAAAGRTADASDSNGDMKVVPMLEVRMAAKSANLPPQAELTPFNITVNDLTSDGQTKVAYLPLSIVTDEKTGQRVAFSAQMRYLPTGAWPSPHQVRLAWVVQALVDQPCDPATDTSADCQDDGYRSNVPQMIQSYYGDWNMTGLTVREEHGTEQAIVYEDPAVDGDLQDDPAIWALSIVLDRHFTVARDADNNNQRDLTVADLAPRFDRDNSPTAAQRMDVPDLLQVVTRSYTTLDQAIAAATMTETVAILNNVFQPHVDGNRQIKPLLLFAQEQRTRQLSLSLAAAGGGYVAASGASLTLDMAPSGAPTQTVDTVASVKWMGYCTPETGPVRLTPCDDDVYWEELERRYGALPAQPEDESVDWMGGRLQFAQFYYTGLRSGYYATVQTGQTIPGYLLPLEGEAATATAVRGGLRGLATVPMLAGFHFTFLFPAGREGTIFEFGAQMRAAVKQAKAEVVSAGRAAYGSPGGAYRTGQASLARAQSALHRAKLRLLNFRIQIASAAASVLQVTMQILSFIPEIPLVARGILGGLSVALNLGITVIMPAVALFRAFSVASFMQLLNGMATISRSMKIGGIVGAVISVALTWGFFIYGAVEGGLTVGSPTLNRAFFEAVAATVVTVLLMVLAFNPIGIIVAAVIGVIDFLLTLICELGVKDLRDVPGQDGACFTLTGAVTKILTKLLYSYDLMVNMERTDLMLTGAPQVTLADPSKGYVGGNTVSISLPVTTTAVHKDPDPSNGVLIYPYMYLFSADNLKRSTFLYSLTNGVNQTLPAALDQMNALWRNVREDHTYLVSPMHRGEFTTSPAPAVNNLPLTVGLNQNIPLTLNMGYAVPAYECWLAIVVPVCYPREFKGDNHMPIDALYYDVLPPTLAGFLALGSKGDGGLGLAWDARFPSLRDADGDGLLAAAHNGLDPNDNAADSDGDGLTDRFELERQAAGVVISPILRDSDGDGLTDPQEIRLGTDPGVADTDNDGLLDGEEVHHLQYDPDTGAATTTWAGGWVVVINATTPFTVRVSSNPRSADSDNDGLTDQTERQLALDANPANRVDNQNQPYHPLIPNSPPLALFVATDDFDGFLAPGQSFRYTNTVIANTAVVSGVVNVHAPALLGGPVNPLALGFDPLTFSTAQTITLGVSLAVTPGSATQQTYLSSTASTRLPDTGPGGWSFAPVSTEAALGGVISPTVAHYTDVTASRPDRQDNYHIAALAFNNLGPIGRGDILAYTLPAGSMRAIENDAGNTRAFLGATAPSMATNTAGDTFAAWGQMRYCNTVTFNSLRVVTAGADGQDAAAGIEPVLALTPNDGAESIVWRWDTTGGSMFSGQQRGTGVGGFPVSAEFCNGTVAFKVYDNDGAVNELVETESVFMYTPVNGVLTFSGAGHTIEVNMTIPEIDRYVIAGAILGPDGQVKRSITFPRSPVSINAIRGSFGPAVATDGSGFLVAYESYAESAPATPGNPQIVVQGFDKDGNPLDSSYQDAGSAQTSDPQYSSIALAASWIGYAYRVVWQDRRAAPVKIIDVVRNGASMSGPLQIFGNALTNAGANYGPSVAYDPITGRVLTVFLSDAKRVIGILQQGGTVIGNPLVLSLDAFPAGRSPQVAWHPGYRGWLVSYQDDAASQRHIFVPVTAAGQQAFTPTSGFFIEANDNSLACPAPASAPDVDLRFEELPGAATFADSSGRANHGLCTGANCPAAGFAGAPAAPLSDYAVQFDGVDDSLTLTRTVQDNFSVAFWIKMPAYDDQHLIQTVVDGGDFNTKGFVIRINRGGVLAFVPGVGFQTPARIDDDRWHFVVVSRHKATGQVNIFVDGALAQGLPGTPDVTLNNATNLYIGKKFDNTFWLRGTLDNLQIIPAALSADAVLAMYNRTLQSYCVAAGASTLLNNVYWAKVTASQPDVRGGRISVSNGLSVTIDSDLPTAQVTAVHANAVVGPAQVIGGVASDPTSGVGLVEVSIDDGAWQPATGANAWAFSLAGQSGAISLRVRATDLVSNVGAASAAINLIVDGTAPAVTINAPPATLKPGKHASGRWQVNLNGTATDANGIQPGSVRVRLEQQSGVGVAQTVQQAALSGSTWSIDYLLDAGLFDPTGLYTATVQATDVAGNRSPRATAVIRLDARGPEAALNQSGAVRQVISQTLTIGGLVSDTMSSAGLDTLEIAFTPVEQIAALPAGLTGEQAEAQLNRVWLPVTLAQRGAGVAATTWSFQIPLGLENLYQIDLRGRDMLGNVAISANLWRGMIDTADPRTVMTATPTGASYLDAGNQRRYAVQFLCAAVDRNLKAATVDCPGKGSAEPTRSFTKIPALQTLFPDLTIRSGLAFSYTLWMTSTTPAATARACDAYGRCGQASTPASAMRNAEFGMGNGETPPSEFRLLHSATPQAVIVAPAQGSYVAANGALSVTVGAEAAALLKTVTISLDGTVVHTLTFALGEGALQAQRTVSLAVADEGPHTLVAQAADWAGATQTTLFPVTFTLDAAPPVVTLDTSTLTAADTWQPQSGILRFNGAATDTVGLAAVQVSVDDGEFVDATFGDGLWQTALHVPDPEGRSLAVTVRAIDLAGRVTQTGHNVLSDLSAADAPDTAIISAPPAASSAVTATFHFTATAGGRAVATFACSLDGGDYAPCSSPWTYTDLSKGDHTFRVRAIDSAGNPDLTPASHAWRIDASALDATITGGPTDPSTSRSAAFTFTGNGAGFECSLDGAAFAACASPQTFTELAYGEHTFAVRSHDGAGQTGAADSRTWTIVNPAPVVFGQAVNAPGGAPVAIDLAASDDDPLSFKVGAPAHGALLGIAPALTYVPDSNFEGTDSFTFVANDGLTDSGVATVTVSVGRFHVYPAQPGVPPNGAVAIRATVKPPQAGLVVSFTVVSGGGSLSAPTAATDASGVAAVTYLAPASVGVAQIEGVLGAGPPADRATVFVSAAARAGGIQPSASGVYTVGNLAPNYLQIVKNGSGAPILGWAEFSENPCPATTLGGVPISPYVDVMAKAATSADTIVVSLRYTGVVEAARLRLFWCNLGAWQEMTETVAVNSIQRTLTFTLTGASSPSIFQLQGTPIVGVNTETTASEVSTFAAAHLQDRVRLTWQTNSELGFYGFHLYRSADSASLGVRLTVDPVWAQGPGAFQGYAYYFDDPTAPAIGETRFYWLEELRSDGSAEHHGPVSVSAGANRLYLPVVSGSETTRAEE
jgi:hypothetical protein